MKISMDSDILVIGRQWLR